MPLIYPFAVIGSLLPTLPPSSAANTDELKHPLIEALPDDQARRLEGFIRSKSKHAHHPKADEGVTFVTELTPYARKVGVEALIYEESKNKSADELNRTFLTTHLFRKVKPGVRPTRAYAYWYLQDPETNQPGVIVREAVDLLTGETVGKTEYLFNYQVALNESERAAAVELGEQKAEGLADFKKRYAGRVKPVVVVPHRLTVEIDGLRPGDRTARVIYPVEDSFDRFTVIVDLTTKNVFLPPR